MASIRTKLIHTFEKIFFLLQNFEKFYFQVPEALFKQNANKIQLKSTLNIS